jgi:hypothetical protein
MESTTKKPITDEDRSLWRRMYRDGRGRETAQTIAASVGRTTLEVHRVLLVAGEYALGTVR